MQKISLFILLVCMFGIGVDFTLAGQELTLYCGRSKPLVQPLIESFTQQTGIKVKLKDAKTAQLVLMLQAEGQHSPADLFWAQDAGALGTMANAGRFEKLPDWVAQRVPKRLRNPDGYWIATSGRARVLAFSPQRTVGQPWPSSVFDLVKPAYRGRVGWAPTNASFQSFVTAMRRSAGHQATRQWLEAMRRNGTSSYPKNRAIIEAIAAGQIDYGLPNHYYLMRFKVEDPQFPVDQAAFDPGDVGNLINVAGIGVLATTKNRPAALLFVEFLLCEQAQRYFSNQTFEYPVTDLVDQSAIAPELQLDDLEDLPGTLELLREVGLI